MATVLPSPRPDAVHLTLHGFATRSKRVAEQLKAFAEAQGVKLSLQEPGTGWIRLVARGITGADALLLATDFARKHGVQVWFWTSLVFDPDNNGAGGSSVVVPQKVMASAEA